jgi:hypothetical protein
MTLAEREAIRRDEVKRLRQVIARASRDLAVAVRCEFAEHTRLAATEVLDRLRAALPAAEEPR